MNLTYEAIILLGRSIEEFEENGWKQGSYGYAANPKCAIGALTFVAYGTPDTLVDFDDIEAPGISVAANTLFKVLTVAQVEKLRAHCVEMDADSGTDRHGNPVTILQDSLRAVEAGTQTAVHIENVVIVTNDRVIYDQAEARQWFSDAIDLLAQELPEPLPVEPPLTVAEILDAKIVTAELVVA